MEYTVRILKSSDLYDDIKFYGGVVTENDTARTYTFSHQDVMDQNVYIAILNTSNLASNNLDFSVDDGSGALNFDLKLTFRGVDGTVNNDDNSRDLGSAAVGAFHDAVGGYASVKTFGDNAVDGGNDTVTGFGDDLTLNVPPKNTYPTTTHDPFVGIFGGVRPVSKYYHADSSSTQYHYLSGLTAPTHSVNFDGGTGEDTVDFSGFASDLKAIIRADVKSVQDKQNYPVPENPMITLKLDGGETTFGSKFYNFENLTGTKFRDTIIGNDADNILIGGDGDDHFYSGLGADTMDGAPHERILKEDNTKLISECDVLDYSQSSAGVTVGMSTYTDPYYGTADDNNDTDNSITSIFIGDDEYFLGKGGHAEGDRVRNFEKIIGSDFNDVLVGNGETNTLEGRAGDDVLNGAQGSNKHDYYTGGKGNDIFVINSKPGESQKIILDFTQGEDRFDVSAYSDIKYGHWGYAGGTVIYGVYSGNASLWNGKQ